MMHGGRQAAFGWAAAIAIAVCLPAMLRAAETAPEIGRVRVGLGDRHKVGLWTPVEVTLRGGSRDVAGELSLVVPDGDGAPSRVHTPVQLHAGQQTVASLFARFGRTEGTLTVELQADGRMLARKTLDTGPQADDRHFLPGVATDRELIVTVGPEPLGVEQALRLRNPDLSEVGAVVRLDDLAPLPTAWLGYEGVDAVVLSTSRPEIYRVPAGDPRIAALDKWVRLGGKLILCVGGHAEEILRPEATLARFAPGRLEKLLSIRQTESLETYSGSTHPVPQPGRRQPRVPLQVPQLAGVDGSVEAREGSLPIVVRTTRGFGQIIFLAADLDQPPLAKWSDRGLLVARLLDLPAARSDEGDDNTAVMHYGFSDIAGQLRSALDQFAGVRLVPFWLLAVAVIVYILLIGPADYFFLRKVVGRMVWTWLTFSLVVVGVSVAAYMLAYRLKGDVVRTNQLDLVDVDVGSGLVRGTSWMNVFSPEIAAYDFAIQPRLPTGKPPSDSPLPLGEGQGVRGTQSRRSTGNSPHPGPLPEGEGERSANRVETLVSWLGLPGGGLGGMSPRAPSPVTWPGTYEFTPTLDAMHGVPIQVWATKSLTARWITDAREYGVQSELTEEDLLPVGSIANTLDVPLDQCILAYNRWAYELGTLEPGAVVRIGPMTKRSELRTLLTGRRIVFTEGKEKFHQESTPYDQSNADLAYVLRMMMFFEMADGPRYTGLACGYQRFVDLSKLLKTNRAILVAQAPTGRHGADLLRDGQTAPGPGDKHVTMYRFVLPVKQP